MNAVVNPRGPKNPVKPVMPTFFWPAGKRLPVTILAEAVAYYLRGARKVTGSRRPKYGRRSMLNLPSFFPSLPEAVELPVIQILDTLIQPGNIIPPAAYVNGLRVRIPSWSTWIDGQPARARDLWWLTVNGEAVTDETQRGAIGEDAPIDTLIPAAALAALAADGPVSLGYGVIAVPAGSEGASAPFIATRDTTPPGGRSLGSITFDWKIVVSGVSLGWLKDNGGLLPGLISDYYDMKPGDTIHPFIIHPANFEVDPVTGFLTPAAEAQAVFATTIPVTDGNAGEEVPVTFTQAQLEDPRLDASDFAGLLQFCYFVTDNVPNKSRCAEVSYLRVVVINAPDDLKAPIVPLYLDDELVSEADARTPVTVQIPAFTNAAEGMEIIVTWQGIDLPGITLGAIADPAPPIIAEVSVPYAVVARVPYRYNATVLYNVNYLAVKTESPAATVLVDVTTPGGPDPEPGTPPNENLRAPKVVGAVGGKDNIIDPDDAEQTAVATIPGVVVAPPAGPSFAAGDVLRFFWNGVQVGASYTVLNTDIGRDITLSVPSATLKSGGTGTATIHYTATRTVQNGAGDPVENTAVSPAQAVQVTLTDDLPGGPGGLNDGIFTGANDYNAINRAEAVGGTPFRIPFYANKKLGNIIAVDFVQYVEEDDPVTPIEATRYTATHVVGPDDLSTYWDFIIPENKLLVPGDQGQSALASYTVTVSEGGLEVASDETFVYIDMR